jgi:rfaE bifunctional protein kinase chain/domain
MLETSKERLQELKNKFIGKKIAIIGDMMLDSYYWGEVKRISPEAPVPVVEIDDEFYRFGGAANCAYNILKLGGVPLPIGVIGYDNNGSIFSGLMEETGITQKGLIVDEGRPTTAKTRVIAYKQHIVRIDRENKNDVSPETQAKIFASVKEHIDELDGIILQDYNKGVLTSSLIKEIIDLANKHNVIVTVDPKFENFFAYKNVTVFKPNKKETEDAFGIKIKTDDDIKEAGRRLLHSLGCKYAMMTLSEKGIAIFEEGQDEIRIPTKARKVSDVSGAGDTVISTLTMALAAGADITEASYLANFAGGIVCQEVGIVPIEIEKLFEAVIEENPEI